jgi:hypothetical protein
MFRVVDQTKTRGVHLEHASHCGEEPTEPCSSFPVVLTSSAARTVMASPTKLEAFSPDKEANEPMSRTTPTRPRG